MQFWSKPPDKSAAEDKAIAVFSMEMIVESTISGIQREITMDCLSRNGFVFANGEISRPFAILEALTRLSHWNVIRVDLV